MKKYVCGICGAEYDDLNSYLECVSKCGETIKAELKAKEEKERLEKVNAELNKVKQAKAYFEEVAAKFKEEYPEEYELNFGKSECDCPHDCKGNKPEGKTETIELSYEDDGKGKPKMTAKVNGKEIDNKALESLLDDPDTKYIAKMLGII